MIPNPNLAASATGSGSSASASYSTNAPPAATSPSSYDSSGASPAQYNQYGSSSSSPSYNQYTSAAPQYTPPPQNEAMPYSSFMDGGYKSMDCGYGYNKGSDGSCNSKESWVRIYYDITCDASYNRSNHMQYTTSGCYQMYQSSQRYLAFHNGSFIESSFVHFAVVTSSLR